MTATSDITITITGPRGQTPLRVSPDARVETLCNLSRLLEDTAEGVVAKNGWKIGIEGRSDALRHDTSLAANGVRDGAELWLQPRELELPEPVDKMTRYSNIANAIFRPVPVVSDVSYAKPRSVSLMDRVRAAHRDADYLKQLEEIMAQPRPEGGGYVVAMASGKGGVGKTMTTILLAELFPHLLKLTHGEVVAIDANDSPADLGPILVPGIKLTTLDFISDVRAADPQTKTPLYSSEQLLRRLPIRYPEGIKVIAMPKETEQQRLLTEPVYREVLQKLRTMAGLIFVDCAIGTSQPTTDAALTEADHVVLVTSQQKRTAESVAETAHKLVARGKTYTLCVSGFNGNSQIDPYQYYAELPKPSGMVIVPWNESAANDVKGGTFSWDTAPAEFQRAYRELGARLAVHWNQKYFESLRIQVRTSAAARRAASQAEQTQPQTGNGGPSLS